MCMCIDVGVVTAAGGERAEMCSAEIYMKEERIYVGQDRKRIKRALDTRY